MHIRHCCLLRGAAVTTESPRVNGNGVSAQRGAQLDLFTFDPSLMSSRAHRLLLSVGGDPIIFNDQCCRISSRLDIALHSQSSEVLISFILLRLRLWLAYSRTPGFVLSWFQHGCARCFYLRRLLQALLLQTRFQHFFFWWNTILGQQIDSHKFCRYFSQSLTVAYLCI